MDFIISVNITLIVTCPRRTADIICVPVRQNPEAPTVLRIGMTVPAFVFSVAEFAHFGSAFQHSRAEVVNKHIETLFEIAVIFLAVCMVEPCTVEFLAASSEIYAEMPDGSERCIPFSIRVKQKLLRFRFYRFRFIFHFRLSFAPSASVRKYPLSS